MRRTLLGIALALLVAPSAAAADISVKVRVEPAAVRFGDPFRYIVEARAHGTDSLRVIGDTGAFAVVGAPTTTKHRAGGETVVTLVEQVACLDRDCLPGAAGRTVQLPRALATGGGTTVRATPIGVRVLPRVTRKAVSAARAPYVRQTEVPPPSTTLPFSLAAALAAVVAALALLGATTFALAELRRRHARRPQPAWTGTRLELALRFLRDSTGRSANDRRRAADFASRVVEGRLADEATQVAWAPPAPVAADVTKLAESVERAGSSA
jgi:hypothetical protein